MNLKFISFLRESENLVWNVDTTRDNTSICEKSMVLLQVFSNKMSVRIKIVEAKCIQLK